MGLTEDHSVYGLEVSKSGQLVGFAAMWDHWNVTRSSRHPPCDTAPAAPTIMGAMARATPISIGRRRSATFRVEPAGPSHLYCKGSNYCAGKKLDTGVTDCRPGRAGTAGAGIPSTSWAVSSDQCDGRVDRARTDTLNVLRHTAFVALLQAAILFKLVRWGLCDSRNFQIGRRPAPPTSARSRHLCGHRRQPAGESLDSHTCRKGRGLDLDRCLPSTPATPGLTG